MKRSAFMYSDVCTDIGGSNPIAYALPSSMDEDLYLPTGCYMSIDGNLILFNSGCSMSVFPYKSDFIGGIKYVKRREIQGISSITKVEGIGMIECRPKD